MIIFLSFLGREIQFAEVMTNTEFFRGQTGDCLPACALISAVCQPHGHISWIKYFQGLHVSRRVVLDNCKG